MTISKKTVWIPRNPVYPAAKPWTWKMFRMMILGLRYRMKFTRHWNNQWKTPIWKLNMSQKKEKNMPRKKRDKKKKGLLDRNRILAGWNPKQHGPRRRVWVVDGRRCNDRTQPGGDALLYPSVGTAACSWARWLT